MSHLSQNLERLIQMISIEQLLGLVKQNNTDNKTNSDILTTPIVQKVVKAYEDELQTLNSVTNPNACVKDYSEDIAKIHEQLASINSNLLLLADAIKNIHIRTNVDKSSSEAEEVVDKRSSEAEEVVDKRLEVVDESSSEAEEHVRLKIEEKQVTTTNESDDSAEEEEEEEESVASSNEVVDLAEEEESEKEISDDEEVEVEEDLEEAETVASLEEESEKEVSDEETEEEEVVVASLEEEEEEEVFEIEIDDVTYYATSEENGILYEVDKDGEVGKKVGIIKDGEPIFS